MTDPQAGSAAVLGDDASHTGAETLGVGTATRHLHVAVDGDGWRAVGRRERDEGTSAERCHTGLAHHGHEDGGEAGIHGIATEFGDVQPRVDGIRLLAATATRVRMAGIIAGTDDPVPGSGSPPTGGSEGPDVVRLRGPF